MKIKNIQNSSQSHTTQNGFTLGELIVVIFVLIITISIIVPLARNRKESTSLNDLRINETSELLDIISDTDHKI